MLTRIETHDFYFVITKSFTLHDRHYISANMRIAMSEYISEVVLVANKTKTEYVFMNIVRGNFYG